MKTTNLLIICMAFLMSTTGCAIFAAARRSESVKKLQLGMAPSEVLQVVGSPEGKEDVVSTPEGPLEVWSYVIYEGGYWKSYAIGFRDGRLASLGVPATEQLRKPAAKENAESQAQTQRPKVEDSLHQAYVAAYLRGYQNGEHDRDAAWTEAIARLVPEKERALKQREALAFVAGHEAGRGEEQARREMQKAWEQYVGAETAPPR
jgi:hypothetical protein